MAIRDLQIADSCVEITKSDTDKFSPAVLYVGTGGNVKVLSNKNQIVTFKNVPDGSILYVMVNMVYSTDTTASDFVLLY